MTLSLLLFAWVTLPLQAQESCEEAVAKCSDMRGDAPQALLCVDEIVGRFPNCAAAHALRAELGNTMGYAAKQGGDEQGMKPFFEKAREAAAKAEQLAPRNPEYALNHAHAAYESGQLDEAYKSYSQTLGLAKDPAMVASAHAGRGCVKSRQGNFDEALKEMDLAMQASPDQFTLITRAEVYTRMGDKASARADYERALSMIKEPPEYKAWVQKNLDAVGGASDDGGRRSLRAVRRPGDVKGAPGSKGGGPGGYGNSGGPGSRPQGSSASPACTAAIKECYAINNAGKLREALQCSGRATKAHASCAPAHFQSGWLWGNLAEQESRRKRAKQARGDWYAAKASYGKAVELDGGDALSIINRGMAEYRLGLFKEAVDSLGKGIALAAKPETKAIGNFDRGLAYSKLGEHRKALADFDAAFTVFKKPTIERADTYAVLGSADQARKEYDQVLALGGAPDIRARARAGLKALSP